MPVWTVTIVTLLFGGGTTCNTACYLVLRKISHTKFTPETTFTWAVNYYFLQLLSDFGSGRIEIGVGGLPQRTTAVKESAVSNL